MRNAVSVNAKAKLLPAAVSPVSTPRGMVQQRLLDLPTLVHSPRRRRRARGSARGASTLSSGRSGGSLQRHHPGIAMAAPATLPGRASDSAAVSRRSTGGDSDRRRAPIVRRRFSDRRDHAGAHVPSSRLPSTQSDSCAGETVGDARPGRRAHEQADQPDRDGVQRRCFLRSARSRFQDVVHGRVRRRHLPGDVARRHRVGETGPRRRLRHEHRQQGRTRFHHRMARSVRRRSAPAIQDVGVVRPDDSPLRLARRRALDAARRGRAGGRSLDLLLQPVPARLGVQSSRHAVQLVDQRALPPLLGGARVWAGTQLGRPRVGRVDQGRLGRFLTAGHADAAGAVQPGWRRLRERDPRAVLGVARRERAGEDQRSDAGVQPRRVPLAPPRPQCVPSGFGRTRQLELGQRPVRRRRLRRCRRPALFLCERTPRAAGH